MKTISLCMIGCGNMGSALLQGWRKALPGQGMEPRVTVVKPTPTGLPEGADIRYVSSLAALGDAAFDLVVWAVKPQVLPELLAQWQGRGELHLSVIAGRRLGYFYETLGPVPLIRCMPNTPATIGQGITALFPGPGTTPEQHRLADGLLRAVGQTVWLEEEAQMDAFTGLAGSGPAYVFYLLECLTEAGIAAGLPAAVAKEAALQTLAGSAALALEERQNPADLRRQVTSPNGTTAAGLTVLMDAERGLQPLITATVIAAARRSKELAG